MAGGKTFAGQTSREHLRRRHIGAVILTRRLDECLPSGSFSNTCRVCRRGKGDRGLTSYRSSEHIWSLGVRAHYPASASRGTVACPEWIYANRNWIERLWPKLQQGSVVATRYEKTASSSVGVPCLGATCHWLKR